MKKNLVILNLFILFLVSCVSSGEQKTVLDFVGKQSLEFKPEYNVIHAFTTDSTIEGEKNGPIAKLFGVKDDFKWEDHSTSKVSKEDLNDIWSEIIQEGKGTIHSSNDPDYSFDIKLGVVHATIQMHSPMNMDFLGFSLFELRVMDKSSRLIHEKTFKIFGLWNGNGMGRIDGPIEMGYSYPNHAIVKLGLYDIVSYIFKKDFLTTKSGGVQTFNHGYGENHPAKFFIAAKPVKPDGDKKWIYKEKDTILVYMKYLMGEEYASIEELTKKNVKTNRWFPVWQEAFGDYQIPVVAKIAHELKWPYFPENIDPDKIEIPKAHN